MIEHRELDWKCAFMGLNAGFTRNACYYYSYCYSYCYYYYYYYYYFYILLLYMTKTGTENKVNIRNRLNGASYIHKLL